MSKTDNDTEMSELTSCNSGTVRLTTEKNMTDEQTEANKVGYIYIFTNDMFQWYGENVYKIGKAGHIEHRLKSYTTGYIDPLTLMFSSIECKNYSVCEREIHNRLNKYRMRTNREFFQVPIQTAIDIIEKVVNELNELDDETLLTYHDDIKIAKRIYVQRKPRILKSSFDMEPEIFDIDVETFNRYRENGQIKNAQLESNLLMLNLLDASRDILNKYKPQIIEKSKLKEHINIIKCLSYIDTIEQQQNNTLIDNKIYQLFRLEQNMNIKRLQVDVKLKDITYYDIPDNEYQLLCYNFRFQRPKPKNAYDLLKLYIILLKHITTNDIIKTTKNSTLTNKKRGYTYKLNKELLLYHIELDKYKNIANYDVSVI
jgi:hypothetical protein